MVVTGFVGSVGMVESLAFQGISEFGSSELNGANTTEITVFVVSIICRRSSEESVPTPF